MSPDLVLIDTSAWLLALGRSAHPAIKERVGEMLEKKTVAITPIISLELLGGTRTSEEFSRLKSRLEALHQLPIGKEEWDEAARMAFQLRRQGKTVPYTDILIGAVAVKAKATVLHADQHFHLMAESTNLLEESMLDLMKRDK